MSTHILLGPRWEIVNYILKTVPFNSYHIAYLLETANKFLGAEFVDHHLNSDCDWCWWNKLVNPDSDIDKVTKIFRIMANNLQDSDFIEVLLYFISPIDDPEAEYYKISLEAEKNK